MNKEYVIEQSIRDGEKFITIHQDLFKYLCDRVGIPWPAPKVEFYNYPLLDTAE